MNMQSHYLRRAVRTVLSLILVLGTTLCLQATPLDELNESNSTDSRLDLALIDAVFNDSIIEHRNIDDAVNTLLIESENENNSTTHRVKSLLAVAHLYWRFGDFEAATDTVEVAMGMQETTDGSLLKARLLDAQGNEDDARTWYTDALASTNDGDEKEFIQIRLAMIDVDTSNVDALFELAQQRDQEFKNRAAITLAVLGHPEKAIDLYKTDEDNDKYFRQLIRLAEWSLLVEDYEKAKENAWLAYDSTDIRFDGLYALTLVDEAYRQSDSLDDLVKVLENRTELNEDLRQLHVDLLIDMERYDEAIALYQSMEVDPNDYDARFRLLQIYDVAGRTDEYIDEYERLISVEPQITLWWTGLASHYVSIAEPEKAREVWERFEQVNGDNIDVLVTGALDMSQMGFEEFSIDMVHRYNQKHNPATTGQIYLFETFLDNGQDSEAVDALNELVEFLPDDAGDLRLVADAFERLHRYERALEIFLTVEEVQGEKLGYDDRMRLAWLQSVIGNREESLNLWQEIWLGEDSPARRNFAEAQFLLIAAELNKLGDIAIDLEKKLFDGTADKNEVNLLVRIYTEVSDSFSASEVVEEFSHYGGISEVEKLRQLGLIYLQLQEYEKYHDVLEELEKIDPENRLEHIQNIVLNLVAYNSAQANEETLDQLKHWLEQLREYDEEAVTGEFEANILSMSGFPDEAIDSYRLALVRQPQHSDNLLLMGDLMKDEGKTDAAVALFQYVAEHAKNDNEFVVAIDGILNMIGQDFFGQRLANEKTATFRWTHRIILERITMREDKFYLYTLLGEIAQETNNTESEFVAIENSISQAGIRRLSVLRELFTMATPELGFFMSQRAGDEERQLTYGRRLIGLRQQLPPSVYISIADTLLRREDPLGAEKSLDLIRDITGQVDPNQTKADLFQKAGYGKKALAFYSHALSLNQDNPDLLLKTASLREGNGQREVANTLYMKGLTNILRSQPALLQTAPPALDDAARLMARYSPSGPNLGVDRTYTTYYEPFAQGVIATWLHGSDKAQSDLETLVDIFRDELEAARENEASLEEDEVVEYTRYSRLHHVAKFLRRLTWSLGFENELANMEAALVEFFSDNESFADSIRREYSAANVELPVSIANTLVQEEEESSSLVTRTEDDDLMTREFHDAIETKDVARVARLLKVAEPPVPSERIFQEFINQGEYVSALQYANRIFDKNEYTRMASSALVDLREDTKRMLNLLANNQEFVRELQASVGPLFESSDDLMELLNSSEGQEFAEFNYYMMPQIFIYMKDNYGTANLLEVYDLMVKASDKIFGGGFNFYSINYFGELLKVEWDNRERNEVIQRATDLISTLDFQDPYITSRLFDLILNFNTIPDNVQVLLAMVEETKQQTNFEHDLEGILKDFYDDKKQDAYEKLLNLDLDELGNFSYFLANIVMQHFPEQAKQKIRDFLEGDCPDEEELAGIAQMRSSPFGSYIDLNDESMEGNELILRLSECDPENMDYRIENLLWALRREQTQLITEQFEHTYQLDVTNESIRTAYFLWSKKLEDYITALAIATDGGSDLRKPEVLELIFANNDTSQNIYTNHPDAVLYLVREVDPQESAMALLRGDGTPKNIKRNAARLAELDETNTLDEAADALRLFWRSISLQNLSSDQPVYFMPFNPMSSFISQFINWPLDQDESQNMQNMLYRIVYSPFQTGNVVSSLSSYLRQVDDDTGNQEQATTLLEHVIERFPLGRELENLLISQNARERQRTTQWYELIVKAYAQFPDELTQRHNELSERVLNNVANDHEFTLWMLISNERGSLPDAEQIAAFFDWLKTQSDMTELQMLNIARFLARIDEHKKSMDYYTLVTINAVRFDEFQDSRVYYDPFAPPSSNLSIHDIIEDAKLFLPEEQNRQLARSLLPLAKSYDELEESQQITNTFILEVLGQVYSPEETIEVASEISDSIADLVVFPNRRELLQPYETVPIMQLAKLRAANNELDRALEYIKPLFEIDHIESSKGEYEPDNLNDPFSRPQSYVVSSAMSVTVSFTSINVPNVGYSYTSTSYAPNSTSLLFSRRDSLFDFDDPVWMGRLVDDMLSWLDDKEVDQKQLIEILAVLAYEYHLLEQHDQVAKISDSISSWFANALAELERDDLWPFATLAIRIDFPLPPAAVVEIINRELFDLEETVQMLQNLRASAEPAVALDAVKAISVENSGLSILKELVEIGQAANDEAYASEVNARIEALESAYDALQRTSVL
ncbi:MAG: hypothetical protein F4039_09600 [Gammaproteobacteria bacterium]|nr:hypothetical protein [Gammaproteobacteria bacterium]MYK44326.1 hypothetical protein [Gammaproteobacteria bacterium]